MSFRNRIFLWFLKPFLFYQKFCWICCIDAQRSQLYDGTFFSNLSHFVGSATFWRECSVVMTNQHRLFRLPCPGVSSKMLRGFFAFSIKITAFADHINITEAPVSIILLMGAGAFFRFEGSCFTRKIEIINGSLYISVPASRADAVKGQVITGTSDQKLMSTSNPTIWENPTYQTVLTSGGADYFHAYISLTWADAPKTGSLVVSKAVNYGSWSGFTFRLHGTSDKGNPVDVTATTGSDGKAYFKDIEIGTYTLEEVSPGNAYILPAPQTVTIPGDDIAYATMENVWKHWRATITKVDSDTGKASPQGDVTLNGAEYTLYKSGKAVATYTVQNSSFTTDLFPCTKDDGVYTLKETKAPAGYKLDETVYKLKNSYDHYFNAENSFTVTVTRRLRR